MNKPASRLVLASASPARAHILKAAGVSFETVPAHIDELTVKRLACDPKSDVEVGDIASLLAQAKATSISNQCQDALVIGADQTLLVDGQLLDKPTDKVHAREQLMMLRGRTHALDTSVACSRDGEVVWTANERAYLTMRNFSNDALGQYLAAAGEDITTSVGGYKIEGRAIQLFSRIEGDYFSILGLPLLALLQFLREQQFIST